MRDIFCPAEWQIMLNANDLISFGVIDRFNCTKLSQANAGNAPMCISTQDGGECKGVLISGVTHAVQPYSNWDKYLGFLCVMHGGF